MCGVVGYIGPRECVDLIFNGLKTLEYRGYDSAGVAVLVNGKIHLAKTEGKLKELEPHLARMPKPANLGIGHTRWATHGPANTKNAHPHMLEEIALVHNGIIENYKDLKLGLETAGTVFSTDTDTEVVLHLINKALKDNPKTAKIELLQSLTQVLRGAFSLGIIFRDDPDHVYILKQGSPLVIGLGDGENLFASDVAALVTYTKKAVFLEDGQMVKLGRKSCEIFSFSGEKIPTVYKEISWNPDDLDKGGYSHYMLKEIFEQPSIQARTISRLSTDLEKFPHSGFGAGAIEFDRVKDIHIVACGTAYLSAMVWRYDLEQATGLIVNVELASEFRYRAPSVGHSSLVIAVSQSGETMDTLESVKYAKKNGAQIFALCNVGFSSIAREAHAHLLMEAGPEIGVASTKAFTSMVTCSFFLTRAWSKTITGYNTKKSAPEDWAAVIKRLPVLLEKVLSKATSLQSLAEKYFDSSSFLFIARGEHYPIALEGALKLKEISYIHAEGYAAGELKHGPIALIDHNMPVIAIAPKDFYYEKTLSNIEQVKARHGRVIGIGEENDLTLKQLCDDVIEVPTLGLQGLQTVLSVIPLQLFSYFVALRRGTDVDQPRNLAKSVTVE